MSMAKNDNTGVKLEVKCPELQMLCVNSSETMPVQGATSLYRRGPAAVPAQHVISNLLIAQ